MKKIFLIILGLMVLALVLAVGFFARDVFLSNSKLGSEQQIFVIKPGAGVNQISEELYQAGLINNKFNFETYVWLLRREGKMIAGEYQLAPSMSLRQLVNLITYGRGTNERRVTIIEGWTNQQIAEYLADNLFVGTSSSRVDFIDDFLAATKKKYDFDFLASLPTGVDLEGYLFPDTYNFFSNVKAEAVVYKMLLNFDHKLTSDYRRKIMAQGHTIHEVVTLASIIEREVIDDEDRKLVSDIFWRRLEIDMPLQADSTVNYLTGKKTPAISSEDRKIDSPYNTYKYKGLPPGPIGNPGFSAITAAMLPVKNNYWYFLTTPDGQVIYSQILAEHNAAKAKYLK